MQEGKRFLLRIVTFNYLHGCLVENPIQTLIVRCHIVVFVWFIDRAWAACALSCCVMGHDPIYWYAA